MQDRYAGDIGDFGKFGLLRHLFGSAIWRLGVVWYLFPNENHNEDGKYINYLSKSEFCNCDTDLANKLSEIVHNKRNVRELEKAQLLSSNSIFFGECLDFYKCFPAQTKKYKERRYKLRIEWLQKAINKLKECNAIFVDPDNGLEVVSCSKLNQAKSGKYIYYSEVEKLFSGKDTLVIYHHLNRHKKHGNHKQHINERATYLKEQINPSGAVFGIRYKPYSPRAYFIVCSDARRKEIKSSLSTFQDSQWGQHWDSYLEI